MNKMVFSTQHLKNVFGKEGKYEAFKKLTYDLNHGNELFEYDDNGEARKISKAEANAAVRKVIMEICELTEEDIKSNKRRKRMLAMHQNEVFELLEDDIDFKIETGFRESEWFNEFVERRNLALGDDEEFNVDNLKNKYFVVANVSGDHHDFTMQYIGRNKTIRIHTNKYAIKVGKDLDLILLGRIDFTTFTDKIAASFVNYVQTLTYNELYAATSKLPAQFKKSGTLGSTTKAQFDALIEDVEVANGEDVVIMGTKVALKQLNALSDVDWRANSLKENVANMGHIGIYEGTKLVEIPQRFALNDTTRKLIDNDMLLIMPVSQDSMPFIKVVDRGETEIVERGMDKADLADDYRTYECQRELGVCTIFSNNFGCWEM